MAGRKFQIAVTSEREEAPKPRRRRPSRAGGTDTTLRGKVPRAPMKPLVGPGWQDIFIRELTKWPNVSAACRKAKVSKTEVYREREQDPVFAQRWAEARILGIDAMEDAAIDLSKISPAMMMFMLKNLKREVYSDTHVLETWQDRVVTLLRERRVSLEQVTAELGEDLASQLAVAAGLSYGAGEEAGVDRPSESEPDQDTTPLPANIIR